MRLLRAISHAMFSPVDLARVSSGSALCAYWSQTKETKFNIGDAINPVLLEAIFKKPVVHRHRLPYWGRTPTVFFTGSILDNLRIKNAVILGAGFKSANHGIRIPPRKVFAVRGPLSRQVLESQGVRCPEMYCDPALILPQILTNSSKKESGRIGLIPHYVDKAHPMARGRVAQAIGLNVIDVEAPPRKFVEEINKCERIISSSLHGVIISHAYGIPATWVKFSRNIAGGGFKFLDYLQSVGLSGIVPIEVERESDLRRACDMASLPDTRSNIDAFLQACEAAGEFLAHA